MAITVDEQLRLAAGVADIVDAKRLDSLEVSSDGTVRATKSHHAPLALPAPRLPSPDDDEDDLYRSGD